MIIKKYKRIFQRLTFIDFIKIVLVTLERHIPSMASHHEIKIHSSLWGGECFYLRRNTTDIDITKIVLDDGYDFLFDDSDINGVIKSAKTVVDAGANIGIFSRLVAFINNSCKIIAIEPEEENFSTLQKNLHGINVACENRGLWNSEKNLKVIPRDTGAWGFVVRETSGGGFDCRGIGIQEIMHKYKIDKIDVLKIDIEGSEYYVFDKTANDWIDAVNILMIELHDRIHEWCGYRCFNIMYEHGFKYKLYSDMYVFYKECNKK